MEVLKKPEVMSDFEVNKELAEHFGKKCYPVAIHGTAVQLDTGALRWMKTLDYCNCYEDIMPVSLDVGVFVSPVYTEGRDVEYKAIHMKMHRRGDEAEPSMSLMGDKYDAYASTPQRALALACIKVLRESRANG